MYFFRNKSAVHPFLFLLFVCGFIVRSTSQDLFSITGYDKPNKEQIAFISLSELIDINENKDILAPPDYEGDEGLVEQLDFFTLAKKRREQFLTRAHIAETDKVFIYSYARNKLLSVPVHKLPLVACLTIYGANESYTAFDFMIGFALDTAMLTSLEPYYENTLVYIGKKNPFAMTPLKPVVWQPVGQQDFPATGPVSYDTSYAGLCVPGEMYRFESDGLQYFLQDFNRTSDKKLSVKHLLVMDAKTKKTICTKNYYDGESASFAPLYNQWTGTLLKNKPPVILGFHWVTFGCPHISMISPTESDIYIKCDNRH